MKSARGVFFTYRTPFLIVIVSAAALIIGMLPLGVGQGWAEAAEPSYTPATFDLFSMFPQQALSPSTGRTVTWCPVEARNISDTSGWLWLSAYSESSYFNALVIPALMSPSGADGTAKSWVLISCSPATPEGTTGYIRITGTRNGESHRVWLKIAAHASRPVLERSSGDPLAGQGYKDPVLQPFTGAPISWTLEAENHGGAQDTYGLSGSCSHPCGVRFINAQGAEIDQVTVKGLTHNYLYPEPAYFDMEVIPEPGLPKNQPVEITVTLGPGSYTGAVSQLSFQMVNPGMLFCINDLNGVLRPHVHQVMAGEPGDPEDLGTPGETTSFILHLTNLENAPADIELALEGDDTGWETALEAGRVEGLPPGETAQVTLTATPLPDTSGGRLDLRVTATSSLGATDHVDVAAEITDVRNVYYFAIDSMDPEYLYLNRAGTAHGSEGNWLMPNLRAFMAEAVNYESAKVYLPSATDMNHTNALAGSYTGTQGLYMVGGTFRGFTEHDEVISAPNSMDLMLYGPDGRPLERIYEVAKEVTGGKALTGFWSNKNWLADIEGERTVDIVGHSERIPLFFTSPYKYGAAGDPQTDENPADPLSGPFSAGFYTDTFREIVIPSLLGQFNFLLGMGLYVMPVAVFIGMTPGNHCEDRYLVDSFLRSIEEEDPDVCYINAADLDNTGHFTGGSWFEEEWDTRGTPGAVDDVSAFSPWMRRDECLDICREVDLLFAEFIQTLRERGVYDNSIIVVLSDHGMENMKDQANGYEVLDLRRILRAQGLVHHEDYNEAGGTEINFIWCEDDAKTAAIEEILEGYTVDDPELGPVQPLIVIDREEMQTGVDYGELGEVRPMELYSEYWVSHTEDPEGHLWPDLFIFPRYNYNVAAHGHILSGAANPVGITVGNIPDNVELGFPAAHGGLQTADMPLIFKAPAGWPAYAPGTSRSEEVEIGDITPTIYQILGWEPPDCVDGKPLPH